MRSHQFGNVRATRVEYMPLPLPPELLGLTADQVGQVPWAKEPWVTDGQINIAAAAWFLEVGDQKIVIDPIQAVDIVLRADAESQDHHQQALATKFAEAGFSPESIDYVLMTHIEDVGAVGANIDEVWRPFFANAVILLSDRQLNDFIKGEKELTEPSKVHEAWRALIDQGAVKTYSDGEEVFPGVVAEVTNKHQEGHSVFHLGDQQVTFIGHLAVAPVHLGTGPCGDLNQDPELAFECVHTLAADGRQLIGSLWPDSGVARWIDGELVAV